MEYMDDNTTIITPSNTKANDLSKKSKKTSIIIALLAVLAVGGIGFGVFELIDNNNKASEISTLSAKVQESYNSQTTQEKESSPQSATSGTAAEENATTPSLKNPVIPSSNGGVTYTLDNAMSWPGDDGTRYSLTVDIQDGNVTGCRYANAASSCQINGIPSPISKVKTINTGGQTPMANNVGIAFILENGEAYYFLGRDANGSASITVKRLPVDGFVTDFVKVNASAGAGYGVDLVILADGSFQELKDLNL